jgi:hypothetical protein
MMRFPAAILALAILGGLDAIAGANPGARVTIPFDSDDRRIYVPVKVNGQGPFLIPVTLGDSATFCWLDTGSALSMHLPRAAGEPLIDVPSNRSDPAGGRTPRSSFCG